MIALLHRAGVLADILHYLPGSGETTGAALVSQPGLAGVVFTGGTETARLINRALAAKDGPLPVLIAETGGLNAMIVDSSALPEQVVGDVIASAFDSAGQRCSALRILAVQEDSADKVLAMLRPTPPAISAR
jgi:RHH-type proline utilization regulon transcriptional repressor/proline dehydrogenase/delta 1-pyrroline-5-carboxylate dehydrogenase